MRAISPVIAAVVLIGVAIAGALLLGYYMTTSIKSSSPKGAAIAVSGVELYYLGKYKSGYYSYKYYYMVNVKVANSGSDSATLSQIKIIGPDRNNNWGERKTLSVNKKILPGETYSDTWTFYLNYQDIQVGKTYVVKIIYTDPYGNTKSVSVNVMCQRGTG
jgi:flagellin-like protein